MDTLTKVLMLATLSFALACAPRPAEGQEPLPLERVVVIGDSTGAASPGLGLIGGVAVSSDRSEVLVVEVSHGPIRVFDLSGNPVRSFGTRVEGPGRMVSPMRIGTTPEGVHVGDHANGQVLTFTRAGELLGHGEIPQPDPPAWLEPSSLPWPVRFGQAITTWTPKGGSGARPAANLPVRELLVDDSGEVAAELAAYPLGSARWVWTPRPEYLNHLNLRTLPSTVAGRGGASDVIGDSVFAFVDSYTGAVSWSRVERGGVVELRSRDLGWTPEPLAFDESDAARALHEERGFPLDEIEVFLPPWRGRVAGLAAAPNQDLWIRLRDGEGPVGPDRGQEYVLVPFAEGVPTRHVVLPDGVQLRGVSGELIVGVRRAGGGQVVEVYRIDG